MRRTYLIVAGVLLAVCALSLCVGSQTVAPVEVWHALWRHDLDDPVGAIVWERVPRTLVGLLVGGALALAGAAMQGLTRNPLADPGLLGVNAGAAFAVVAGLQWAGAAGPMSYVLWASVGAGVAAVAVYAIAGMGRDGATPTTLVLAGAAATALLMGLMNAVLVAHQDTLDVFRLWQVGSIGGRGWPQIRAVAPFLAAGAAVVLASARGLDALALGEDLARGLGTRVGLQRAAIALGVVLLCGPSAALAGPIAFVGLMVPHALRMIVGPAHGRLLPLCILTGGVLLVAADVVGRVIAPPAEMQVGVMIALIGVPVFVWLLRHGRQVAL